MAKKKKEEEKKYALISGELVEIENFDVPAQPTFNTNEPLDRSLITDDTKKELAKLLVTLPEIKPVIEILIGKKATEELQ